MENFYDEKKSTTINTNNLVYIGVTALMLFKMSLLLLEAVLANHTTGATHAMMMTAYMIISLVSMICFQ